MNFSTHHKYFCKFHMVCTFPPLKSWWQTSAQAWSPMLDLPSFGIALNQIRGSLNKFPDFFFVWALLLIVHTWNSSPLRSNLLRLQCTCCTVPTTSAKPHGRPLVWACQWPSSQPLSSIQLSHNDSLWA